MAESREIPSEELRRAEERMLPGQAEASDLRLVRHHVLGPDGSVEVGEFNFQNDTRTLKARAKGHDVEIVKSVSADGLTFSGSVDGLPLDDRQSERLFTMYQPLADQYMREKSELALEQQAQAEKEAQYKEAIDTLLPAARQSDGSIENAVKDYRRFLDDGGEISAERPRRNDPKNLDDHVIRGSLDGHAFAVALRLEPEQPAQYVGTVDGQPLKPADAEALFYRYRRISEQNQQPSEPNQEEIKRAQQRQALVDLFGSEALVP